MLSDYQPESIEGLTDNKNKNVHHRKDAIVRLSKEKYKDGNEHNFIPPDLLREICKYTPNQFLKLPSVCYSLKKANV